MRMRKSSHTAQRTGDGEQGLTGQHERHVNPSNAQIKGEMSTFELLAASYQLAPVREPQSGVMFCMSSMLKFDGV